MYPTCLTITGVTRETSKERLYKELGLESFQHRRWNRKLCYLYKNVVSKSPNYLLKVVPSTNTIYNTWNTIDIPLINVKHNFFKNTFFPSTIIECNNLGPAIRNSVLTTLRQASLSSSELLQIVFLSATILRQ